MKVCCSKLTVTGWVHTELEFCLQSLNSEHIFEPLLIILYQHPYSSTVHGLGLRPAPPTHVNTSSLFICLFFIDRLQCPQCFPTFLRQRKRRTTQQICPNPEISLLKPNTDHLIRSVNLYTQSWTSRLICLLFIVF